MRVAFSLFLSLAEEAEREPFDELRFVGGGAGTGSSRKAFFGLVIGKHKLVACCGFTFLRGWSSRGLSSSGRT